MYADLHVHTSHSDGELAPAQVVGRAKAAGVSLLAICDHNLLSGSLEAAPLAARVGIRLVYGVEIDSLWRGVDLHVLGLNVDPEEPGLVRLARESRDALDGMSDTLLRRMRADGLPVSVEEFRARPAGWSQGLGGWPALHYLVDKGLAASWRQAVAYYGKYQVGYAQAPFHSLSESCAAIRGAGGVAILAHPGDTPGLAAGPGTGFDQTLEELAALGVQGLECHYPSHDEGMTAYFLGLCRERGLYISAGSDCHSASEAPQIGCLRVREEELNLPFLP